MPPTRSLMNAIYLLTYLAFALGESSIYGLVRRERSSGLSTCVLIKFFGWPLLCPSSRSSVGGFICRRAYDTLLAGLLELLRAPLGPCGVPALETELYPSISLRAAILPTFPSYGIVLVLTTWPTWMLSGKFISS